MSNSALDQLMRQVPAFKEWVPMWLRVTSCLLFIVVFQFSGGFYMASMSEMAGATSLMHDDVMMAAETMFVGITMIFPILFRLKFRLSTRVILPTVCVGLIVCNWVCMNTSFLPLLSVAAFLSGCFKMWGTFECFSSIQLRITPTRDFAVFFPVIYGTVFGCIQLSGLTTTYMTYYFHWHYMHYLMMGLLFLVAMASRLLFRDFHFGKPLPLYGIDWLGAAIWSLVLILIVFVANYGEFYDWTNSPFIRLGVVCAFLLLVINLKRMFRIRHPYIEVATFRYRHVVTVTLLFGALSLLTSAGTVLQGSYTGGILGYDSLNNISLNWPAFAGCVCGALFTWQIVVRCHASCKTVVFIGFACVVAYSGWMYFIVSPEMNIERLYWPVFLKNAGNVILYVVLTTYISQIVPFQHFFQALCAIGFVREGVGGPISSAFLGRVLKILHQDNYLNLGGELDALNHTAAHLQTGALYGELQVQSLLVSIKELFGYVTLFGIVLLLLHLCTRYVKISHVRSVFRVPVVARLLQIEVHRERQEARESALD